MSPQLAMESQRRAQQALARSPIYDLRELRVENSDDALLLSGSVTSFYHKQLAQEVVRSAVQGVHLVNSVEVTTLVTS